MRIPIATVMMVAMGLSGCEGRSAPASAPAADARTVRVVRVEPRRLQGGVSAGGLLVAREEVAVGSELSGYRVARVLVEPDARVRAGQPLVLLDDTLLRAQTAQQAALAAQQQVAVDQADLQAKDVAGLEGQGVLSGEQIEARRFQARSARAALAAQLAQLRDSQTRQARMTVRAPVDGLGLERNVRPGDVAAAGGATPMFRLARDGLVELEAEAPEASLGAIRVGDAVEVDLPGGQRLAGAVRLISPSIDSQTKLGKVRVRLPLSDDLRVGGFGQAVFSSARTGLAVPESAIRYDGDGAPAMVVDAADRVSQVFVKTGLHAGGYVELLSGPPAGARVLLGAAMFVLPGDRVRPIEADLSAAAR